MHILFKLIGTILIVPAAMWVWINLGQVPHYGDTFSEYLPAAKHLEFQRIFQVHGVGTPLIIWAATGGKVEYPKEWEHDKTQGCVAPARLMNVQIAQIMFSVLALIYACRVLLPRVGLWGTAVVAGLVAFDPLVAHHNLALMPDGPALSFTVLFAAALADKKPRALPLLFLATAGASLLRFDRGFIFVAVAAVLVFLSLRDGRRYLSFMAVFVAFMAVAVFNVEFRPKSHIPETFHYWEFPALRMIAFGNFEAIYLRLPEKVRERFSEEDMKFMDLHQWATRRRVFDRTKPDERPYYTLEFAKASLRYEFPAVVENAIRSALSALLAGPVYYGRLYYQLKHPPNPWPVKQWTMWTWHHLSGHTPQESLVVVKVAASVLAASMILAPFFICRLSWGAWFPVAVLMVILAAGYTVIGCGFEFRKVLPIHVLTLLGLYGSILSRRAHG